MFSKMNWQIPVYGAILINQACDKVLLVQTLVSNEKGGAWMFPRGKMEKRDHGASFDCACREVGFCGGLLNSVMCRAFVEAAASAISRPLHLHRSSVSISNLHMTLIHASGYLRQWCVLS
jgi:hypothetical protein